MASAPRRRSSMEEPPDLADQRDKLLTETDVFIQQFDDHEGRLRGLVAEMKTVSELVRGTQSMANVLMMGGVVPGGVRAVVGVGLGLFIFAAPLIGGLALALVAAVLSGAAVAFVNITKIMKVNRCAEKAEELGSEFLETVEPMGAKLEEIKSLCERLDGKAAAVEAENTLADMQQLQTVLHRTSALRKRSRGLLGVGVAVLKEVRDFLTLFASVLRVTATHQQDESLGESIVTSADQIERVTNDFYKMKDQLQNLGREFENSKNKQS